MDRAAISIRRHERRAIVALLLLGSAVFALPARADEPPPGCSDERWVKRIKTQYQDAETLRENRRIKELRDLRETHLGPAPKSFNQYASAKNYIANVRWCQATLALDNGETDTLFWYLADQVEGDRHSTLFDHCSTKHDTFKDKCVSYREFK
jgi:hypothetical protein